MNDIKMAKLVEIYKGEGPIQNIDFCYEQRELAFQSTPKEVTII